MSPLNHELVMKAGRNLGENIMKAMILAAGRGTRLAPLTNHTPKPMLAVKGKPLIEWQIRALAQAGIRDLVINLHHLGEQIESHLGSGHELGVSIAYSHESALLETGGGIKHALPLLGDDPFAILNGDIWTDFNFARLPAQPDNQAPAQIVVTPTPKWRDHGDFEYDDGLVTARGTHYVYCGIAVLRPELLYDQPDGPFSLRDTYFSLLSQGRLRASLFEGTWVDIGTAEQYNALNT